MLLWTVTYPTTDLGKRCLTDCLYYTYPGLSALQYVNLNSSRNLYIIGFSIFFPLVLTRWMAAHSGVIQTGAEALDAVLQVLLSTSILVGGVIGCLLDNLIPGKRKSSFLVLTWFYSFQFYVSVSSF